MRCTTLRAAGSMATFAFTVILNVSFLSAADHSIQFNRDIRPILTDHCFSCHGPDSASRKADLRLDIRDAAIERKALHPGDVAKSEFLKRIESTDADEVMPPPSTNKKLTAEQKELLKTWVAQGAEYQLHWSFLAPVRPKVPVVKNQAWVPN